MNDARTLARTILSILREDGRPVEEDAPANAAGTGAIAGLGVGVKGEPGVDLRKKRKQFDPLVEDDPVPEKPPVKTASQVAQAMRGSRSLWDVHEEVKKETFAGADVFETDMDRVSASRFGKNRYHRYSKYVGVDETGEAIRQVGRQTKRDIVLKDGATGAMVYLRRKATKT